MKLGYAQAIVDADTSGDVELYEDYSGRGMFGKTTAGVVGTLPTLLGAVASASFAITTGAGEAKEEQVWEFVKAMRKLRVDDMGKRTIIY